MTTRVEGKGRTGFDGEPVSADVTGAGIESLHALESPRPALVALASAPVDEIDAVAVDPGGCDVPDGHGDGRRVVLAAEALEHGRVERLHPERDPVDACCTA